MASTPTAPSIVAPADTAERRVAERLAPSSVPGINGIHLSPGGGEAHLVNISTSGVLVRCATRLLPGTAVTVVFDGGFKPSSVKGKVVRCLVADIAGSGGLSYHIGIHFKDAIDLPVTPEIQPEPAPAVQASAAVPPRLVNRW
jgi:PilZ domain